MDELHRLIAGRYIPDDFTLIGKPMPKNKSEFHENPPYSILKLSGWRNTSCVLLITTDSDDRIESFEIATYDNAVSPFKHPHSIADDPVDIVETALFICDQYSEEEWSEVIKM